MYDKYEKELVVVNIHGEFITGGEDVHYKFVGKSPLTPMVFETQVVMNLSSFSHTMFPWVSMASEARNIAVKRYEAFLKEEAKPEKQKDKPGAKIWFGLPVKHGLEDMAKLDAKGALESTLNQRNSVHGDFEDNADIYVKLLETCEAAKGHGKLTPRQRTAIHYIIGKLSRILSGDPNHADHWHDIAGYAALGEKACRVDEHHPELPLK